jgi:hypothetical protein
VSVRIAPVRRRIAIFALCTVAVTAFCACSTTDATADTCDRVAAPNGSDGAQGTTRSPYRTAQRLVNSLSAGQTGCLRQGTYTQSRVTFDRGGRSGAPITLASYPGERARLAGIVTIPSGSDFVRISRLDIDGAGIINATLIVTAFDVVIEDSDITNRNQGTQCVILGGNGWGGPSGRVVIQRNRIHNCGRLSTGDQEHGIYFENTVDTRVVDNQFWGAAGFALHIYPNARRSVIAHNVIDGNRYGVIVAGNDAFASSGNTIAQNVITNTSADYNLRAWWENGVGTDNVAIGNCVHNGFRGDVLAEAGLSVTGTVVADPLYVDAANHDYRLQPGSACLAAVGYDTAAKVIAAQQTARPPSAAAAAPASPQSAPQAGGAKRRRWPLHAREIGHRGRHVHRLLVRGRPGSTGTATIVVAGRRHRIVAWRNVALRTDGRLRARIRVRPPRRMRSVKVHALLSGVGRSVTDRVRLRRG